LAHPVGDPRLGRRIPPIIGALLVGASTTFCSAGSTPLQRFSSN
jgi:hypothetical protein